MGFPYPRKCNWFLSKRNQDGSYTLKECHTGVRYTLGSTIGFLWRRLDGRTDPMEILPGYTEAEISQMLDALDREKLLRHSRVLEKSLGSITWSLIFPRHQRRRTLLPVILNAMLHTLWLPVLIWGIFSLFKNIYLFDDAYALLGQLVGLFLGIVCHEAGHAIAALGNGGRVLEAGVMLRWGLPGAYVLLDDTSLKRLSKVQIYAAGVESNFLLTGTALILAAYFPGCYGFFFGMALGNLLLGLLNLTFINSLDGMHIIQLLLGYEPLEIIKSKAMRNALKKEGPAGRLELLICYILKGMQVAYPAVLILNVLELVLWIITD